MNPPLSPLYFDYAATTPLDLQVKEAMIDCLSDPNLMGNASSITHDYGTHAKSIIEIAKADIRTALNAPSYNTIFTSGATESINLALKGAAFQQKSLGNHIITVKTEHQATLDTCHYLEQNGFDITYLPVKSSGLIDHDSLALALRDDTILVSIMHVNNETGLYQDLGSLSRLLADHQALFHVDAAQSIGKIPVDLNLYDIDLLSFTAHKFYGPKGAGALLVKPMTKLSPQMHGGTQQYRMRAGTLATHQIIGLSHALVLATQNQAKEHKRLLKYKQKVVTELHKIGGIALNGEPAHTIPDILNVCVQDVDGEALMMALYPLAISQGAACSSATTEPSHVLTAMGLSPEECYQSIRLSFGRFTTDDQLSFAIKCLSLEIQKLRKLAHGTRG